jgi:hypothetical protein
MTFYPHYLTTFSVFVKPAVTNPRNFIVLEVHSGANSFKGGFNISTGATVGSTTATGNASVGAANFGAQVIGNGWYRIHITGVPNTTASGNGLVGATIYMSTDGSTTSYTGDNASGFYIWGAQLETLNAPTSYILSTTGSATERSVEGMTLTTSAAGGAWFGNSLTAITSYSIPNGKFSGSVSSGNSAVQFPFLWRLTSTDKTTSVIDLNFGINSKSNFHSYKGDSVAANSPTGNVTASNGSFFYNFMQQVAVTDQVGGSASILRSGGASAATSTVTAATSSPFTTFDLTGSLLPSNPNYAVIQRHYNKITFRPFALSLAATQTMTSQYSTAVANAGQSTVVASAATASANGSETVNIVVTLNNASGNPVQGKTVTLTQTSGSGAVISIATGTSSPNGKVGFMVKSSTLGAATFTATSTTDTVTVTQTATVTFN